MNIVKQITRMILMIILILSILTVTSRASIQGKVIADNVRLRSEASTDAKILTLISINEQVEVIERQGEWYQIEYKDNTGYIKAEFIELQEEGTVAENTGEQQETSEEATQVESETLINTTSEKTVAGEENVYILPLLNAKVVETIKANTTIQILQSVNGWSYITTGTLSGWIRTDQLVEKQEEITQKQQKQEEATTLTPKTINQTGYINATSVNFRKEPNTSAEVIMALTLNTEVTILTEQEGWYQITVKDKTGHVSKDLVSDKKKEVTSRSADTATTKTQEATDQNVTPTDNTSSELGTQIANYAKGFVGYPYVYGGSSPSGFDCSGFTSYVYQQFGYSISRSSAAQAGNGVAVAKADLQPGDLVLFKGVSSSSIGHVGIYIGGNQFVHASTEKTGVKISSLSSSGYIARYVTARRII